MDILILKTSALGDVLRTTSLLRPLLKKYPKAKIIWVTSSAAMPLLENNPYLAEAMPWDPAAAKRLEGRPFDLVLSMEEDEGLARLAGIAADAREVVGVTWNGKKLTYTPSSSLYYDMSLLNRDADGGLETANAFKKRNQRTYIELWCRVLKLDLPSPEEGRPVLTLTPADRTAAQALEAKGPLKRPLIGFNPSAGGRWPAKRMSSRRAGQLMRALKRSLGAPVLLLGGPEEAEYTSVAMKEAGRAAIDAGTGHSLRAFAGILEMCDAVLTADSLALHMANALKRPAAVFVGPTSVTELDLFDSGVCIAPESCVDFYKARCTQEESCLDRIPDQLYVRAVEGLLRKVKG